MSPVGGPWPELLVRNAIHPTAVDVTAVTTYRIRRSEASGEEEERGEGAVTVSAFGTNTIPGGIHFVSYCERTRVAFHEGHVTLPPGVGAVRSAASMGQYAAFGTDQSPAVVVPGGALRGPESIVLEPGENILAAAAAGVDGTFLFATWTAPTRIIKFRVDEDTQTLVRAGAAILPQGVDYVRAAAADPRRGVSYFATDTAPAVIAKVRHSDLALVDAIVLSDDATGGRFIRAGAMRSSGGVSYWATFTSPTRVIKIIHEDDDMDQSENEDAGSAHEAGAAAEAAEVAGEVQKPYTSTMRQAGVFEMSSERGEEYAASLAADADGMIYIGFSAGPFSSSSATSSLARGAGLPAVAAVLMDEDTGSGEYDETSAVETTESGVVGSSGGIVRPSGTARDVNGGDSRSRDVYGVPGARALLVSHAKDGVGYFVTRSTPALLVAMDHRSNGIRRRDTNVADTVSAQGIRKNVSSNIAMASDDGALMPPLGACRTFVNASHMGVPLRRRRPVTTGAMSVVTGVGLSNVSMSSGVVSSMYSSDDVPNLSSSLDQVLLSAPIMLPDLEQFTVQKNARCSLCSSPIPPVHLSSHPAAVSVSMSLLTYSEMNLSLANITVWLEFKPSGWNTARQGERVSDESFVSVQLLRGDRPEGTFISGEDLHFATFSDAATKPLPRAERWPSLLIDAIDPVEDAAEKASEETGGLKTYLSTSYAGLHLPEESIMRGLETAAMTSIAEQPESGKSSPRNMTSGGEWRLVIRAGAGAADEAPEGDLGKLIFWSINLCGNPNT